MRSLHNELKKVVAELHEWKSGTGVQARAGRNALLRGYACAGRSPLASPRLLPGRFIMQAEIDELRRAGTRAAYFAMKQNWLWDQEAAARAADAAEAQAALAELSRRLEASHSPFLEALVPHPPPAWRWRPRAPRSRGRWW